MALLAYWPTPTQDELGHRCKLRTTWHAKNKEYSLMLDPLLIRTGFLGPKLGPIGSAFSAQNGGKLRQINESVDGS